MKACIDIAPPNAAPVSSIDSTHASETQHSTGLTSCSSLLSCDRTSSLIVWPSEKRMRSDSSNSYSPQLTHSNRTLPHSGLSQWSLPKTMLSVHETQGGTGGLINCQGGTGDAAETLFVAETTELIHGLASEIRQRFTGMELKLEQLTKQIEQGLATGFDDIKKGLWEKCTPRANPTDMLNAGLDSQNSQNSQMIDYLQEKRNEFDELSARDLDSDTKIVKFTSEASTEKRNPFKAFTRSGSLEFLTGGTKVMIWDFLEDPDSSCAALTFSRCSCVLILLSTYGTLYQTVENPMFDRTTAMVMELLVDSWFLVEFLMRFSVSMGARLFFQNIYNIIDLLAATPLALRWICIFDPEGSCGENGAISLVLDAFVPVFRLLKIMRCFQHSFLIVKLLRVTGEAMLMLLYIMMVMVLLFSAFLYVVEDRTNIESMLASMWLTIVTLTTVGYGDVYPESPRGKVVGAVLMLISVLYMSMPIGVIGNAFTNIWHDRDRILLVMKTRSRLDQLGFGAMDCHRIFTHFDRDKNGVMDITEFRCMVLDMMPDIQEERVIRLYDMFDKDGSGSIEFDEFIKTLFPDEYHQVFKEVQEVKLKRTNSRMFPSESEQVDEEIQVKKRVSKVSILSQSTVSDVDYTATQVQVNKRTSLRSLDDDSGFKSLRRLSERRDSR